MFSWCGLGFIRLRRVTPGEFAEVKTKITAIQARIVILMSDRKLRGFGKLLSRRAVLSGHVSIEGCYVIVASPPPGGRGNRVRACRTASMSQSMLSRKSSELPHHVDCNYIVLNIDCGSDLVIFKCNWHNHRIVIDINIIINVIIINAIIINTIIMTNINIIIIGIINNMVITSIVASRPPTGWANRVRAAQCDMTRTLHISCKGCHMTTICTLHYI